MRVSFKMGLLPRIVVAIALGALSGLYLPEGAVRFFATVDSIFSSFLGFAVSLIILAFVTVAIAGIGSGARRLLLITAALAYGFTVVSGLISFGVSTACFPQLISEPLADVSDGAATAAPYLTIDIPPVMGVMTALVLSFIVGLGIASLGESPLKKAFEHFAVIINKLISKVVIPLLPIYIFGIFAEMAFCGKVASVLVVFLKIIGVIFIMHFGVLLLQYCLAGAVARRNPIKMLANMSAAYFTALGTQSSAATIPVTLQQVIKNGVSEPIARFVVPLCATIHLSGSTLKIVACATALMLMEDIPVDALTMVKFIFILGITMVAAPGVPGGAIMAALGILQSVLGFDEGMQALMIALYIAMDSFGTACNVTGDGAIAAIIDKIK